MGVVTSLQIMEDSESVGKYCDVKNSLDVNKVYYYSNTLTDVSYKHTNGNSYTYKNAKYPMIYINDTWKYYNGSSWINIPDKVSRWLWKSNVITTLQFIHWIAD